MRGPTSLAAHEHPTREPRSERGCLKSSPVLLGGDGLRYHASLPADDHVHNGVKPKPARLTGSLSNLSPVQRQVLGL
jgi:hypothetical protein